GRGTAWFVGARSRRRDPEIAEAIRRGRRELKSIALQDRDHPIQRWPPKAQAVLRFTRTDSAYATRADCHTTISIKQREVPPSPAHAPHAVRAADRRPIPLPAPRPRRARRDAE